jgi:2-succinyl-5-enolpyruvyl-6-hydroxy-3-cyclohexene-1-carboxylate synthase
VPAVAVATSGTAAANFLPAAVEARHGQVPLLLLTADRPRDLRDTGAPQTIDQVRLYGAFAKWFLDLPDPQDDPGLLAYVRRAASRAFWEATSAPAGPVHVNLPFAEPLLPEVDAARAERGRPYLLAPAARPCASAVDPAWLPSRLDRALVVAGPGADPRALALSRHLAAPILADPLSGLREAEDALDSYDLGLRDEQVRDDLQPSAVFRLGRAPVSKALGEAMAEWARAGAAFVHLQDGDPFADPWRLPGLVLPSAALAELLASLPPGSSEAYRARWQRVHAAMRAQLHTFLAEREELFEGKVWSELARTLPRHTAVVAGNSMPVRYADAFLATPAPFPVFANRGANGIDGVVSTAAGVARALGRPTVLVLGDLSLHHDQQGLLLARQGGVPLTVVVVHNDGGGIFSFLPQASLPEFEGYFATPHGLDFAPLAELYGLPYRRPQDWPGFRQAVLAGVERAEPNLVEVRTDRRRDAELFRQALREATAAARVALGGMGVEPR